MRATGITRKVDSLGRVVIPKELRNKLYIEDDKDCFEIFVDDDAIILKKYQPSCCLCGSFEGIKNYKNKYFCKSCLEDLQKL